MSAEGLIRLGSRGYHVTLSMVDILEDGQEALVIDPTDTLSVDLMSPDGTIYSQTTGITSEGSDIIWTHQIGTESPINCPGLWKARGLVVSAQGQVSPGSWYEFEVGV